MPNIPVYERPKDVLQPTESGINARLQNARRAGAFFNQQAEAVSSVGEGIGRNVGSAIRDAGEHVVAYEQHREISHGAAAYAGMNDDLTSTWNDIAKNSDPNDPTVAANFKVLMEQKLTKFQEAFNTEGGQKWAESRVDSLRNHMFEKTTADMATRAGQAAVTNARQTLNHFSNTAMTDPSAVPKLLGDLEATIGEIVNSSPNLKGAAAGKLQTELMEKSREQIVRAGAIGAIQKSADPEKTAQEWGAKYPDYINGAELKQLANEARSQMRARRVDAAYADHMKEKQAQKVSDEREGAILKDLYSDDPKKQAQVSTNSIVNDMALNRPARERMVSIVNREMKPETDAKVSAATFSDLATKIRSGEITDLATVFAARAKGPGEEGSLNKSDALELRQMFADMQTPDGSKLGKVTNEFMKSVAPQINATLLGQADRSGPLKNYEFDQYVRSKVDEFRKAGKNPYDLFTPGNAAYLGKPEIVRGFMSPLSRQMSETAERITNPPKPPSPTRTIDKSNPPMPGATWDDKKNSWVITMGGRTFTVKE